MPLDLYNFLAVDPVVKEGGDLYWFCRDSCFLKMFCVIILLGLQYVGRGLWHRAYL